MIKIFLARESLVSDIPAGDGKTANLFYSVNSNQFKTTFYPPAIMECRLCLSAQLKRQMEGGGRRGGGGTDSHG
jgi:hypothetical protein